MNEQVRVIKFTGKNKNKDNVPNMELRNRVMSKVFNRTEKERRILFAKCAQAAYWNKADGKQFGKQFGWKAHQFIDIEGAQVHIWQDAEDLVISARGTEPSEMNDIYADLEIFKSDSFTGVGQIHQGFREEVDKVWDSIFSRVEKYGRKGRVAKKIWVCGHSLGGAMATLIASRLEYVNKYDVDTLYTYGSPRAGGPKFAKWCNTHLNHQRFVNNNDVVPCVPSVFRWRHNGRCKYIKSDGTVTDLGRWSMERIKDKGWGLLTTIIKGRLDFVADHNIVDYIKHLEKDNA